MADATFEYVVNFTIDHEGDTPFMYDNRPFKNPVTDVTIGIGHALHSEGDAMSPEICALFRVKSTGQRASPSDMQREYRRVKVIDRTQDNLFSAYQRASPLEMDRGGMLRLLRGRLLQFWASRGEDFPNFAALPAQVQAALMSWNYGLRLRGAPKMCRAIRAGDFTTAATESRINGWDAHKNAAHKVLLLNGAALARAGGNLAKLPPLNGPFRPPPSEPGAAATTTTLNSISFQLVGRWSVIIGNWSGFFTFEANGTVSWSESANAQRHKGHWAIKGNCVEWKFNDVGDFRTFSVPLPLAGSVVNGTILPAGQGWFKMVKGTLGNV